MPWIKIELSQGRSVEQKRKVAEAITDAMETHCGCRRESVSIVFQDVSDDNWAIGGTLIADRKR